MMQLHPINYVIMDYTVLIIILCLKLITLLGIVAFYTIAERKLMASIQRRKGPNVAGILGLLQSLADGFKLLIKEMLVPMHSKSFIFIAAPICILFLSFLSWMFLPTIITDATSTLSEVASFEEQYNDSSLIWGLICEFEWAVRLFCISYFVWASNCHILMMYMLQDKWEEYKAWVAKTHKNTEELEKDESKIKGWWNQKPKTPGRALLIIIGGLVLGMLIGTGIWPTTLHAAPLYAESIPVYSQSITFDIDLERFNLLILSMAEGINTYIIDNPYSILFLFFLSSLNVYSLILAGWSSNSKYAFLGALRSSAQMISYEVSMALTIMPVIILSNSFNLTDIVLAQKDIWNFSLTWISAIIFFISMLAETNRTPFDLTEAEAELVAGYNVEYSSMVFSLFFLGEYSNMLIASNMLCIFFFGGGYIDYDISLAGQALVYIAKVLFFAFLIVVIRATFPRYRYDQLMFLGWKVFLLISFANLTACIFIIYASQSAHYIL